jgi:hypothetical protein
MALTLSACLSESCDGISFVDNTGPYSADNLGGYGVLNDITGPGDFDSYTLKLWGPSQDPSTDDPLIEQDLLLDIPTADDDGYYTWPFTAEELGVDFTSGVWYMEVVGVLDGDEYTFNSSPVLLEEISLLVDAKMKGHDPTCPCKKGCQDPGELFENLQILRCGSTCSIEDTNKIIAWLRAKIGQCC